MKTKSCRKSQIKCALTFCLVFSNTLGVICSSPYVYASNSTGSETIRFHINQYTNTPVSNDENQAPPTEDNNGTPDDLSSEAKIENSSANAPQETGATLETNATPETSSLQSLETSSDVKPDTNPTSNSEASINVPPTQSALRADSENLPPAQSTPKKMLQGQAVYTVPSGTPIKLKMASVPSHPMKMMNRDIEGNLYPARLGQGITARTTEDIYIGKNKLIPEGTIFSGKVSQIFPARRVGRPGSLVLSFDKLTTPDGRQFAFRVEADNRKASTYKTKAKGFGIIAYHAFGGAVVGALVAYEIFGWQNTIALHGYNIAAGAAAGALIATGYAIMRKGPKATLEPGDDLNMSIDQDLLMPIAITVPEKKVIAESLGLTLHVEKSKIVNDGLDEHFVTVDLTATNEGDKDLSSIDLFLEDTNQERHPVSMSPDENSQFLFHLEPHSTRQLHVSFLTQYPKLKQKLVWIDHETKIVLASEKLQ